MNPCTVDEPGHGRFSNAERAVAENRLGVVELEFQRNSGVG
jgi:hypothetical protein